MKYALLGFLLLFGFSFAYILHLVTPVDVYLEPLKPSLVSPVGPGYKVILAFDRDTGKGFVWDNLQATSGPWNVSYAKDHKFLYAIIQAPRNAEEGNYTFSFMVSDRNGDHIQEDAMVKIHVTHDPSDLAEIGDLLDSKLYAMKNGTVSFILYNKALGEAEYRIDYWVEGTGKKWEKEVVMEAGERKRIDLPLTLDSAGFYHIKAKVQSLDTPIIHKDMEREYYVRPTLKSKLSGIIVGFPLVPVPLAPVYTILGLFGFL